QILTSLSAPTDLSSIEAFPMILHHQEFLTHFSTSTVKTAGLLNDLCRSLLSSISCKRMR
ncbi:MAG TPA: hypothetical protein DCE71_04055, partial [Parachlamydiales bacterium]|nr:hypothetical protein [Parachlamydiales bacterium]